MIEVLHLPTPGKRPLLERMVFRGIVFNMSWEDPEMDRRALQVGPDDTVLSITSAGCNPLNLLGQSPKRLLCVDGNYAQNALMELKVFAIANLEYDEFFDIFAARRPGRIKDVYDDRLRPYLSDRTRLFWDRKLKSIANGLYRSGRMGMFCKILRAYLRTIGVRQAHLNALFESETIGEQREVYYAHIAPRLWRYSSKIFVSMRPLMYLAGVHPRQMKLVDDSQDFFSFLKGRLEHVLTNVPTHDNYFFSQVSTGRFRGDRVPPYLQESNFETLRENLSRITMVTGWLKPYLDTLPPGSVNKFNLLDIFDWMTDDVIRETLHSVARAASPDARMIYRSGTLKLEPPPCVAKHLRYDEALSRELLSIDRTATYGSFYLWHFVGNGKADSNGSNGRHNGESPRVYVGERADGSTVAAAS